MQTDMDQDTAHIISAMRSRGDRDDLSKRAADAIERLQGQLIFWKGQAETNAASFKKEVADLATQRDAALAEVEWLKARDEKQSDMIRTINPLNR